MLVFHKTGHVVWAWAFPGPPLPSSGYAAHHHHTEDIGNIWKARKQTGYRDIRYKSWEKGGGEWHLVLQVKDEIKVAELDR